MAHESSRDQQDFGANQPAELEPMAHQTRFAEDVVIADYGAKEEDPQVAKRKKLLFFGGTMVVVVLGVLTVIAQRMPDAVPMRIDATPQPSPEAQEVVSPLRRVMQVLEQDIERADPVDAEVGFPPVDFTLRLEDATLIQQSRR